MSSVKTSSADASPEMTSLTSIDFSRMATIEGTKGLVIDAEKHKTGYDARQGLSWSGKFVDVAWVWCMLDLKFNNTCHQFL